MQIPSFYPLDRFPPCWTLKSVTNKDLLKAWVAVILPFKSAFWSYSQWLKIIPKSHIASEASYLYNLDGHKFIKNAKNGTFCEFLKSLWKNRVTRQINFYWTKIGDNAKIEKLKCDILSDFQTLWSCCLLEG